MNELEVLYGAIGLGLITLFLPYLLQVIKLLFKWDDQIMLWVSVVATYFLVDLYYLANVFDVNPSPTLSGIIYIILGMIIYPLLVWFGTQGVYTKLIRPTQQIR
jgi:nitrate/nitrite transporter NarK